MRVIVLTMLASMVMVMGIELSYVSVLMRVNVGVFMTMSLLRPVGMLVSMLVLMFVRADHWLPPVLSVRACFHGSVTPSLSFDKPDK